MHALTHERNETTSRLGFAGELTPPQPPIRHSEKKHIKAYIKLIKTYIKPIKTDIKLIKTYIKPIETYRKRIKTYITYI